MALSAHTGSFNITTAAAGNTVAVTGLGFQPKAIIFWWSGRTEAVDAGGSATLTGGIGFAVSASSFCALAFRDVDGIGTSNTDQGQRDDACILETGDSANVGWADLQSMDSDGFTVEIIDAFTINLRVSYIAYGGSDITNAEIGRFTATGAAPVNQSVTNAGGFRPDITFFCGGSSADPPVATTVSLFNFGVAIDASNEYTWSAGAANGSANGATASYCRAGECYSTGTGAVGVTNRAEFVSHDASGFTINWLERANANRVYWLSIKGGAWKVGDLLTQTDTTTAMAESGFGFAPAGALFVSAGKAQSASDTTDAHFNWSMGAATSTTNRGAQEASSRNGNTTMFCQTFIEFDEVYIDVDPTTDAIVGLMDIQSFDSDGFTAIMDDADPSQAFVWYVAAGSSAAAAVSRPLFRQPTRFIRRSF